MHLLGKTDLEQKEDRFLGKNFSLSTNLTFDNKQIGTLVLAPPMIGLMAGVAIPATIVGVPIWTGRQIRSELKKKSEISKGKRRALVGLGSTLAFLLSPLVAGVTGNFFYLSISFINLGTFFKLKFSWCRCASDNDVRLRGYSDYPLPNR